MRKSLLYTTLLTVFIFSVFSCQEEDEPMVQPPPITINHFIVQDKTYASFILAGNVSENGKIYVGVVTQGSAALSNTTIKTTPLRMMVQVVKDQEFSFEFPNLMIGQAYDIYVMAEDSSGKQTSIQKLNDATLQLPNFNFAKQNESYTRFYLLVSSQIDAKITYVLKKASEEAETANSIATAANVQTTNLAQNSGATLFFDNLTPNTEYKLYYLIETPEGLDLVFQAMAHTTPDVGFAISKTDETPTSLQIAVSAATDGFFVYAMKLADAPELTSETIGSDSDSRSIGITANVTSNISFSDLNQNTDYVLYYSLKKPDTEELVFDTLTHSTPAPSFLVTASVPANNSSEVKVYDPFEITFDRNIELSNEGNIILRSINGVQNDIRISGADLSVSGNTLTINSDSYFRRTSNLPPINMHFGEAYKLVINRAVKDLNNDIYFEGEAIRFTAQAHPDYDYTVRNDNAFTGEINWNSVSDYHRQQLTSAKQLHNFSRASAENLSGDDVKVMIWDTGIYPGSEIYDAVVYQKVALDDKFIGDDLENFYNHGTQMARYAMFYAPSVNLYDNIKVLLPESTRQEARDLNDLQIAIDNEVDVMCLAGSGIGNDHALAATAVKNGLVLFTSLGNTSGELNDTTNYKWREKFLPYLHDLRNGSGAFVCTQAIIENGNGYESLRSQAGHAKHYTLCILETGVGATSQAASSSSGIMALMIEANRNSGNNYTKQQLVEILFETAVDIGAPGVDNIFGHGYIDIDAAITKIKSGTAPTFQLYENMDAGVSQFFGVN